MKEATLGALYHGEGAEDEVPADLTANYDSATMQLSDLGQLT